MYSPLMALILGGFCFYISSSLRLKRQTLQSSTVPPPPKEFSAYWNVPSHLCLTHKVEFKPTLDKFGIKYNDGVQFRGDTIILLYDPGEFPIVKNNKDVNGGVPQLGDYNQHVTKLTDDINQHVPVGFKGVGVIDFEVWRPVFRQNWNDQAKYKAKSITLQSSSSLTPKQIENLAKDEFEKGAKKFMEGTLKEVKALRPDALWGYYGFPHSYNQYETGFGKCADLAVKENDGTQWLFEESTALYPSVYMNESITGAVVETFVATRLEEAKRLWEKRTKKDSAVVLPYVWHKYKESENFLTSEDIENVLKTIKKYDMGGFIIWASSGDLASDKNCSNYLDFIEKKLGPALQKIQNPTIT